MSWPFQGFEWVILLVIILLIFGPKKLPELARGLGQAIYEFRKASSGLLEGKEERKEEKEKKEEAERKVSEEINVEQLKKLAEKLGISTEGKSEKELIKEIMEKAKKEGLLEEKSEKSK